MTREAWEDDNTFRHAGNASKQSAVFERPSEVQKREGGSEPPRDDAEEQFGAGVNDRA